MKIPKRILPIIVFSQFCGTSLWFSGNAVMPELVADFNLQSNALAHLTSAVQLGFIAGTLIFAISSIADRFSPIKVFVTSTLIAAIFNLGLVWAGNTSETLFVLRFLTGFFLAGIYPVGMKIAADYYDKGLGRSMGYLVGALVLGTAFPHLLRSLFSSFQWQVVMVGTSGIAALGGFTLMLFVPDGPRRSASGAMHGRDILSIFKIRDLKDAALGYFGHMWELYAFWALVPTILTTFNTTQIKNTIPVHSFSFLIITVGAIACVFGGYLSEKIGVRKTAKIALLLSAICCLVSPLIFEMSSPLLLLLFLCFWGMVVIADSPLFSTLVAQNAEASTRATAITLVTCIGFGITIISIQLLQYLQQFISLVYLLPILSVGPLMGLYTMRK